MKRVKAVCAACTVQLVLHVVLVPVQFSSDLNKHCLLGFFPVHSQTVLKGKSKIT